MRSSDARPHLLRLIIALAACPAFVAPQDSAPADGITAIAPVMVELQKGSWNPDKLKTVIEALIAADHHGAATWWAALGEEAVAAKKLPPNTQAMLTSLRKRCELQGASADDRKL